MALSLLKRTFKGGPLTYEEMDNNLTLIESAINSKVESNDPVFTGTFLIGTTVNAGTGILQVSGNAHIDGRLQITGGSFATGSLYSSATYGLVITGKTGSTSDMLLATIGGDSLLENPTGTLNVTLVKSGGNALIGSSTQLGYKLEIHTGESSAIVINSSDSVNRAKELYFRYCNTGDGGMIKSDGPLTFWSGASTPSKNMTLTGNGNLLVGTAIENMSKFQVEGTSTFNGNLTVTSGASTIKSYNTVPTYTVSSAGVLTAGTINTHQYIGSDDFLILDGTTSSSIIGLRSNPILNNIGVGANQISLNAITLYPVMKGTNANSRLLLGGLNGTILRSLSDDISTHASNTVQGISLSIGHNAALPSTAYTNILRGSFLGQYLYSGSAGTIYGQQLAFYLGNNTSQGTRATTATTVYGVNITATLGSSPSTVTVTDFIGYSTSSISLSAGSSIQNYYGIKLSAPTLNSGTITNNWGVYQEDINSKNYFNGNVGIGISNPVSKLAVSNAGAEGIELRPGLVAGSSEILAYNRSTSSRIKLDIDASEINLKINGSGIATISSSEFIIADNKVYRGSNFTTNDYSTMVFNSRAWETVQGVNGKAFSFITHTNAGGGGHEPLAIYYGESGKIAMCHQGGDVLIGTTGKDGFKLSVHPGTGSNKARFGTGANCLTIGHSGGDYSAIAYNAGYTTTSGQYTYLGPDTMSVLKFNSGYFSFYGASAGASGATVTPTRYAQINSSGLVVDVGSANAPEFYVDGWFRNNVSGSGLYNQVNGNHIYSSAANYWNITTGGLGAGGLVLRDVHAGATKGYLYHDSSGFGLLHSGGGWSVLTTTSTLDLFANGIKSITINSAGLVGIGYDSASYKLHINGACGATTFNTTSLRSAKENIQKFDKSALDIINNTEIVSFNFKEDEYKEHRVGFIADDTDKIIAGINNNKFDIPNTIGILLKAVQELSEELERLKNGMRTS